VFVLTALVTGPAAAAIDKAGVERQFRTWLEQSLWLEVSAKGVSRKTFEGALRRISLRWRLPDLRPPGAPKIAPKVQAQAEFRSPAPYFKQSRINNLVKAGRARLARWADTLARIEAHYGVPRGILVAIWGRESAFGRASIPHNALSVLATQAFMGRRKAFFHPEIVAALQMLQDGQASARQMKSSWAGALGQPQLLPTKFRKYAVDFDGDGKRDIWNSVPDTLATIAHYLQREGWQAGRDWGFEAAVPDTVACSLEGPDQGKRIRDWVRLGVARVAGRKFPAAELGKTGFLLMPAGRNGPAWIATPNFYVLKAYNESDLYALFIGHLADRFRANRGFIGRWGAFYGFTRRDVQVMQQKLEAQGHDVGGADGLVGFKTRRSIGRWQAANGLKQTCVPNAALVKRIKAGN